MQSGGKWITAVLVVFTATGVALAGGVDKTTVKDPDSWQYETDFSPIGAGFGFHGPGAIASTSLGGASFWAGSLDMSLDGVHSVQYEHTQTGHSHYRLLATFITGLSYSYANSFSFWFFDNGNINCTNLITYESILTDDGTVQVVLSGDRITSATANATNTSDSDFETLFESYITLVNFEDEASLTTFVSSTSSITATPTSAGVANGQIAAYVLGF